MRLFYVNGEAQVSMSLEEFTTALKDAKQADSLTVTVNGVRRTAKVPAMASRAAAGRKRVGGRTGERIRTAARRMVSRRPMKRKATSADDRRRAGLKKARAVLAAKRKKASAQRRQPKRDWGAIIAKRNATIAKRNAEMAAARAEPSPMAEAQ